MAAPHSLRVTFDSNVWENVVLLEKLEGHKDAPALLTIRTAIVDGGIEPFLSDVIVLFEAVKKKNRAEHFGSTRTRTEMSEAGNKIDIRINVERPEVELPQQLRVALKAAIDLGFKFIKVPRIGQSRLPSHFYAEVGQERLGEVLDRTASIAEQLDARGFGRGAVQPLIDEVHAQPDLEGLHRLEIAALGHANPKKVAEATAEWADADAIAAHAGYGLDYFCTLDEGSNAGKGSILHQDRRDWLRQEFGIQIVSPAELVAILENRP